MSQIITLTFSPCIDKSFEVDTLVPDIKLSCSTPIFEPGGGGINVSRALQKLGTPSLAVYPYGGYMGSYFNELLYREKVNRVAIPALHETRQNVIIIERSTGKEFRFGMPCMTLQKDEWNACINELRKVNDAVFFVVSGSLPADGPQNIWEQIASIAKIKNAKLVVDTKIHSEMLTNLGIYLVKPNLRELALLAGVDKIPTGEIKDLSQQLIRKGLAEVLLVSLGADGAMLVDNNRAIKMNAPQVKRKSTVGAGDSMIAGLIHYLHMERSLKDAARYAVACGTAATLVTGTRLCSKEDADKLLKEVSLE